MNEFPHGCCDLSSNFLAQYLKDSYPALTPVIDHMETTVVTDLNTMHGNSFEQ